jgi:putative MATE family efflux protein
MAHEKKPETDGNTDRKLVPKRDWTKGSISRNLLSLSWPIMISSGLMILAPTIDMIWVGKLGAASIAGIGISGTLVWVIMAGRIGINTGMMAMVARFIGAEDNDGANHVAQQAFIISTVYAVTVALLGIFSTESILTLMGLEADVVAEGAAYLRIMLVGSAAMSFQLTTEAIMQASGDAMTPMRISVIFRIIHVALVPFLVFGWSVFPRLGVSGAAITNVISQSLGLAMGLFVLFTGRTRLRLTLRNFRVDFHIIWRIVRIGIPAALSMAGRMFGRLGLMWFMVPFGTLAVAAHSLITTVELIVTIPGFGFGRGAGVLVGQNLGAQQPGRAERSAWLGVGFASGIVMLFLLVFLLWPELIIRVFSPESDLIELATVFLMIAVLGFLTLGFETVLAFSLSGAGDTVPPMLFTMFSFGVQLLLAFLLPRITDLGVYGVRWAMVIGMLIGMFAFLVYFRLGRWKHKRI